LLDSVSILSKPEYSEEFFDLCKYKTDSLVGKTLYLGYKLTLSTTEIPFNTNVVIDISDNNGKPLVYQYICLNWLKLHYSGESQNFFNGMLIHKIPPEAATFKSYLWNLHKVPFSVKGSLYLFQLTK